MEVCVWNFPSPPKSPELTDHPAARQNWSKQDSSRESSLSSSASALQALALQVAPDLEVFQGVSPQYAPFRKLGLEECRAAGQRVRVHRDTSPTGFPAAGCSWLCFLPPGFMLPSLPSLPPPLPRIQYVPTQPLRQSWPDMWTECTHCVHTHASRPDLKPTGQEINCGKTQLYYTLCKQPPNLMTPPHRGTLGDTSQRKPKTLREPGQQGTGPC